MLPMKARGVHYTAIILSVTSATPSRLEAGGVLLRHSSEFSCRHTMNWGRVWTSAPRWHYLFQKSTFTYIAYWIVHAWPIKLLLQKKVLRTLNGSQENLHCYNLVSHKTVVEII